MSDPSKLSEMVRAMREFHAGDHVDSASSRARILGVVRERKGRRRRVAAITITMATLFAFSSAWGAMGAPGQRELARVFAQAIEIVRSPVRPRGPARPPASPPRAADVSAAGLAAPDSVPAAPAVSAEVAAIPSPKGIPVELLPQPDPPSERPALLAHGRAPAGDAIAHEGSGGEPEPPAFEDIPPEHVSDPDLDLYKSAHRAHFVGRDAATALERWNAYLAAYPSGRFSIDARYNRALCLLRLGRVVEAAHALEPFASGRYGEYRRDEARRLIARAGAR